MTTEMNKKHPGRRQKGETVRKEIGREKLYVFLQHKKNETSAYVQTLDYTYQKQTRDI